MRKISSFALFAFLMPLAGCPAGDDTETDTVADTANMTTAPVTDTGSETTPPAESESGSSGVADSGTADSGTGPGGAGSCQQTCAADPDCPGGTCGASGFCEYAAVECDPATCIAPNACANVNGASACVTPCDDDSMCLAGVTECTGTDDDGNSYCAGLPCGGVDEGAACEIAGFGSIGTCTGGMCTCTEDAECTAPNFTCNAG
jgi:hypothetical protein